MPINPRNTTTTTPAEWNPNHASYCRHEKATATVEFNRRVSDVAPTEFNATLRIKCVECGTEFAFLKPDGATQIQFPIFPTT